VRIVVLGATGNVGTSLLGALRADPGGHELAGVARRPPRAAFEDVTWHQADIRRSPLEPIFEGADAVVHLAWAIQPSHDGAELRATNVLGTQRVLAAVAAAGVPALVYASSVGTYARGPARRPVDESWPATGIPTSFYSRHKAETESMLDRFEREHPDVRVVRLRPSLIFKRDAGREVAGLFLGRLAPRLLANPRLIPLVPRHPRLRFQVVHTDDVADAYRRAIIEPEARGAFNIAADPLLDGDVLGRILGARPVPVPASAIRAIVLASWRLHLQPTPPGWVDMGLGVPVMDCERARRELGWSPRHSSTQALLDLMTGIREGRTEATPATAGSTAAPL
jgi:nucleoside-diphosphate-sugar epimerase